MLSLKRDGYVHSSSCKGKNLANGGEIRPLSPLDMIRDLLMRQLSALIIKTWGAMISSFSTCLLDVENILIAYYGRWIYLTIFFLFSSILFCFFFVF